MSTSTCRSEELYWEIVFTELTPLMVGAGFRPWRRDWFLRWNGDSLLRLSSGFTKDRGVDQGSLQVFVCVGFKRLADFLSRWSEHHLHDVKRPCAMATDLGHLSPQYGYSYQSWLLTPDSNVRMISKEVSDAIVSVGLPFLEHMSRLENALAAWEAGVYYNLGYQGAFYLAAAHCLRGEWVRAVDIVESKLQSIICADTEIGRKTEASVIHRFSSFLRFLRSEASRSGANLSKDNI